MIKPNFERASPKVLINIGALLDIPTGTYVKGSNGESVLLGGLAILTGVYGRGNHFKSTILHYMMLSAANRLSSTVETSMSTYDTELNANENRLTKLASNMEYLKDKELFRDGHWILSDVNNYYGEKWFEILKDFLKEKVENRKDSECITPFLTRDGKTPLTTLIPTFSEIDSLSEFITSDVVKMQDENEIGDSGGNTMHMRAGLAKTRLMMEASVISGAYNHYMLFSAQLGQDISMPSGPFTQPTPKKLQHMKQGEKVKGVSDKFFTSLNNSWETVSSTLMLTKDKTPEYPKDSFDNTNPSTDLNLVKIKQVRGKSGMSGYTLDLVVSQSEGVLPSLTEFHFIKDKGERFGLTGSVQNYSLDLYPDVKLSRTTIRSKIDNDPKLRRALNITSELCQMYQYYRELKDILMLPKDIYESLKQQGYDWDMLLSSTRGWWAPNDKKHPLKFLSTMDIILAARDKKLPYWMNEDKSIKNEYK